MTPAALPGPRILRVLLALLVLMAVAACAGGTAPPPASGFPEGAPADPGQAAVDSLEGLPADTMERIPADTLEEGRDMAPDTLSDRLPGDTLPTPDDVLPGLILTDADELTERAARPMTVSLFEADAGTVGMDPAALRALDSVMLAAVAEGVTPGAALAVGRRGRLVRLRGYGTLDWPPEGDAGRLVTPATLYDLASLTKVVGTTTAIMILDGAGRLELDAPVVRYLPWWSGPHPDKERVTVRQLLLHRAGLPSFRRWFTELEGDEAYRRAVAEEPLEREPGEATVYSDIGAMTLAWIVEAITGQRLDHFLQRDVFVPLGMQDTRFLPDAAFRARIAPTEVDTLWRGTHVHGVVHDENAFAAGGVAGHAGLFSTAWDLSIFARMMLAGGALPPCEPRVESGVPCSGPRGDSVRILDPETIRRYSSRHDATSSRALGWDTPEGRSSAGDHFTPRAFGHTGFTGTSIWMDPELDLFVVLLTNRVNPTRANTAHVSFRREVHDRAARAIMDRPVPRRDRRNGGGGTQEPGGR